MKRAHCALGLDLLQRHLLAGDQAVPDGKVVLADERDAVGVEGERVERGGHRTLDRVLERHERAVGLSLAHRQDRVVDGGGGDRLHLRVSYGRPHGVLAEGPAWA